MITKEIEVVMNKIIDKCAADFNVAKEDILGKSRVHEYTIPRYALIYALERLLWPFVSHSELSRVIGGRHHSTITYAVTYVEDLLAMPLSPEGKLFKAAVRRLLTVAPEGFRTHIESQYRELAGIRAKRPRRRNVVDGYLKRMDSE